MKNIPKKILKIIAGIIISLIILITLGYFFIQTESFNRWALQYTLDELNKDLQTRGVYINADSIQGNILEGLILKRACVSVNEDTLFSFSSIELKYDLRGLLENEIRIENFKINSPVIKLSKIKYSNDSTLWNISKLFSSSKEKDTSESVFDWGVVIENLKIENGEMTVKGQSDIETPHWRLQKEKMKEFDFNNLEVRNLELELNAQYFPEYKNINFRNLSFTTNSDFNVRKFTMTSGIDHKDSISELHSFELITDRSDIKINVAKMTGFNPFDSSAFDNVENIKDKDIEADIEIRQFNFADLKFFVPSVDMLDSTVGLTLNVNGKYGDLNINRLNLALPNSEINLSGNLKKLEDAANLYMDVHIKDTRIFPKDVKTIVKIGSIPDYSHIGTIYPDIIFTGTYEDFYSKLDVITPEGNVSGHINMNLQERKYSGSIVAENLNPGKIFTVNSLNGKINVAADFSGIGFNTNSINANVKYQMDRSNIAGYDVRNSAGNISLAGRNAKLNIRHSSSIGSMLVKGSINFSNLKNPGYRLSGNVSNLNIASITKSAEDRSNLNFSFDINGSGITQESINGNYNFSILPSQFGSMEIPQTLLTLNVKNSGSENLIDIVSDIADLKAEGKFKIKDVINAVRHNVAAVSEKLLAKLKLDSVQIPETELAKIDDFILNYSLAVKDSVKTNHLLFPFDVKFNGRSSGHLENNNDSFSISSVFDITDFAYKDTMIVLNNFSSNVFYSNEYMNSSANNSLEGLQLNLKSSSDRVMYENSSLDSVNVLFNLNNSAAVLTAEVKDSTLSAYINGIFDLNGESIVSTIDSLSVKYGRYNFRNWGNWMFSYIPNESIRIQQMRLGNKNAEVNIYGNYSFRSPSDISIEGNDLRIRDLVDIFYSIDSSRAGKRSKYPVEGLLKQLSVNFKGTFSDPVLNLIVNSSDLKYEGKPFGTFNINGGYKDENAILDINLINEGNKGKLTIAGNYPLENPLRTDSSIIKFTSNPVSLRVSADEFQYQYFLKLIPGMPSLSGVANGELVAEGTANSPALKGSMKIERGNFFSDLTGMNYNYDLTASAENSKLIINTLKLYNAGDESRHIDIYGNIDLTGMKLNDIDLMSSGDITILDKSVDRNELGVYGNVNAGIGSPGISIKGNFERLKISGQLLLRDAALTSLPKGRTGYNIKKDNFIYILTKQDSNLVKAETPIPVSEDEYYKVEPFMKSKYIIDKEKSIAAGFLDIDVDIKTVKNIIADIDFSNALAKLNGEMKANLKLKTENKELKATGSVEVVGNSYFKFYKDFKLKDSKIIFDGKLGDPLLNIQAVHTGTKVSEQYGNSASTEVQVKLTVTGRASEPKLKLSLIENGSEMTGPNVQTDAVSYLLYGKFKSELTESERTSVAAAVGAAYISSYVMDVMAEIFPILSDATFTVGDKPMKELKNFEFSVDYPLNNILQLNLPETLMMQFFREELDDNFSTTQSTMNTGMRLIYKIKF